MQLLLGFLRMLLDPRHHAVRKPNLVHMEKLSGKILRQGGGAVGGKCIASSQLFQLSSFSLVSTPSPTPHYSNFNHCLTAIPERPKSEPPS